MPTTVSVWGRKKPLCPDSDTCQDTDSLTSVRILLPGKTPSFSHGWSSAYVQAKDSSPIPHCEVRSALLPATWGRWASLVLISPYQNASRSWDINQTGNCIYRSIANCFNKTLLEKTFVKIQITLLEYLPQWEYYDSEGKKAHFTKKGKSCCFPLGNSSSPIY